MARRAILIIAFVLLLVTGVHSARTSHSQTLARETAPAEETTIYIGKRFFLTSSYVCSSLYRIEEYIEAAKGGAASAKAWVDEFNASYTGPRICDSAGMVWLTIQSLYAIEEVLGEPYQVVRASDDGGSTYYLALSPANVESEVMIFPVAE